MERISNLRILKNFWGHLFTDLKKIEKKMILDHSIFGYFDQCQLINEILSEHGFFQDFMREETNFDISSSKI